ncbi:MAG: CHAT domain-containing protein [Cytophagales bacterium]|nr:CHAT domain-containing protein [Cytophagales bacterium]
MGNTMRATSILKEVENAYREEPSLEKIEFIRQNFYKAKIFRSQKLLDSSEFYHKKALNLAKHYNYDKHNLIGEIWMDLGLIQARSIGNTQKAIAYYSNAQTNFSKSLDKKHIKKAVLYYALAINYRELGDFERAVNYARLSELNYKFYGDKFINRQINCKIVQGNCYFEHKDFIKANGIYNEVIEIFTDNVVKPTRNALISTLSNNGVALFELGQYTQARQYIERSIQINPLEYDRDSISLAYGYLNLALTFEKLNQLKKAEEFLLKSLSIRLNIFGQKHRDVFRSYRFLGKYYENRGQSDKALDYYQKSLDAAFKSFSDQDIYTDPASFDDIPKIDALYILFDKARAFKNKYGKDRMEKDILAAFDLYKTAYELIRKTANSGFMEESLLNIPESFQTGLYNGLECALILFEHTGDQKYLEYLLQFVETNKYFLLQNSIAKSNNRETLGIPDSAYQKERELLSKINALKQEVNNAAFENDQEEYSKRLDLLYATIDWDRIRERSSSSMEYSFSLSGLSSTPSLEELREGIIGKQDILLEYFQTSGMFYTLALSKKEAKIFKFPKSEKFEAQLTTYLNHIMVRSQVRPLEEFEAFVRASYDLYEQLVHPVLSAFDIDGNYRRLIIIPENRLSSMPFESLIRDLPENTALINYYGLDYLCRNYTINYAYSINVLKNNFETGSKNHRPGILAFSYSSSDHNVNNSSRNDTYEELPYSEVELRNIRKRIENGKFLYGDLATESNFKSNVRDYNIIHLALHGAGDTSDMLNSQIIFKDAGSLTEDGYLYAHELYGIDLSRTDMAVLSACETGVGKNMQGEGIYSLARGFAYAGCPSIVMSLWKVNDETTAELMDYFYKYIIDGLPKDEALRLAKLAYIRNANDLTAHPAHWAAFIALGNNQPIPIGNSISTWPYWLAITIVLAGVFYFFFLKPRIQRKVL